MASKLVPGSDTLTPLTASHRHGLIAVTVLGFLSFVATTSLCAYITYKLTKWYITEAHSQNERHDNVPALDLQPDLFQVHSGRSNLAAIPRLSDRTTSLNHTTGSRRDVNQFLLLVYNLLIAEMHQSTAFLLNVFWASNDGVLVGTPACWAQGWFISVGDLAASCFITAIAVHTYLDVVRGYKPPQWALYLTMGCLWFFVYGLGILGILITNNGHDGGGLYVRAVAWCWMNVKYESLRLWLHYFWIFVSLALTSGLYILIFFTLSRPQTRPAHYSSDSRIPTGSQHDARVDYKRGSHPGFLIYPVIYAVCTAPLALARVATMAGSNVSVEFFCFAACMIASNGWLDVLLFSWTRSTIIFAPSPDTQETGIDSFAFMRTPHSRRYGNMVWVQGASKVYENDASGGRQNNGGWWKLGGGQSHQRTRARPRCWQGATGGGSQESLRGGTGNNEIQMDTVTSVVVEISPSGKELAQSIDRP